MVNQSVYNNMTRNFRFRAFIKELEKTVYFNTRYSLSKKVDKLLQQKMLFLHIIILLNLSKSEAEEFQIKFQKKYPVIGDLDLSFFKQKKKVKFFLKNGQIEDILAVSESMKTNFDLGTRFLKQSFTEVDNQASTYLAEAAKKFIEVLIEDKNYLPAIIGLIHIYIAQDNEKLSKEWIAKSLTYNTKNYTSAIDYVSSKIGKTLKGNYFFAALYTEIYKTPEWF